MLFAKDSYMNREYRSYQYTLKYPYIHRLMALHTDTMDDDDEEERNGKACC